MSDDRLASLRTEIEAVDRAIIDLLAKRVQLALDVGVAKREAGLPTLDPAREAAVIRRAATMAREAGVSDDEVRQIFWHVIGLCRGAQLSQPVPDGKAESGE